MIMLTALFTALIAAGAFIKIPMIPVPMTLQTLFVFLAGLLLTPSSAASALGIYIILGAIGLPIFTSGGGLSALFSPTGGFIFGFLVSAIVGSFLAKRKRGSYLYNIFVVVVMEVITYLIGIPWLKVKMASTWAKAFAVGMTPFIIGDAVKMAVSVVAGTILYPETEKLRKKLSSREKED